jgi:hypothetical protein
VLASIMQFYFYKIDRNNRCKMIKGTCLATSQRKTGTLQTLDLESLRRMAPTQCYLTLVQHNQSINATNMYIMNLKYERESDHENFGVRMTEFGVVVGKI